MTWSGPPGEWCTMMIVHLSWSIRPLRVRPTRLGKRRQHRSKKYLPLPILTILIHIKEFNRVGFYSRGIVMMFPECMRG